MKRAMAEITVVGSHKDTLGECPMWHPKEQCLYWVDTRAPALRRLEQDGHVRSWAMPNNIGSFVFREVGGLVAGLMQGFSRLDLHDGSIELIHDPEPEKPANRLNDGRCDRMGRYWCGSRDPGNENAGGALYCLGADYHCSTKDSGFIVPNGMAFSPDDRTFTFGDSRGDVIWNYDFDLRTGEIGNKRVYLETSGLPWRIDGATYDIDGYYWAALIGAGAIGRFDAQGRLDRLVELPVQHPTMCNFGGPDLDVLYVTSGKVFLDDDQRRRQPLAGSLFAIRGLGTQGVPEPLFKG